MSHQAAAANASDVIVAVQCGDASAACQAFRSFESDSSGYNTFELPEKLRVLTEGRSARDWYQAAQSAPDQATRCVALYRAELAERLLQATPDYDQHTFIELQNQARQLASTLSGALRLTQVTPPVASAEASARYEFVYHHPSKAGLPVSCQANWSTNGQMAQACARDLLAQADIERKTGNCSEASIDYINARTAGFAGGDLPALQNNITSGLSQCQAHR